MFQSPLLSAIRIRGPFQRDHKPHGQYGVDAVKEMSLVITGADRVDIQSVCTSLREVETVSREFLSFKSMAYSHNRELLTEVLGYFD